MFNNECKNMFGIKCEDESTFKNKIDYSDVVCHDIKLKKGVKLYHYIYGEIEVVNIKRVRTKFYQFNYIECKICNVNSISPIFLENYNIKKFELLSMILTFRSDNVNEWLYSKKEDILTCFKDNHKDVEQLYYNDIYIKEMN